MASPQVRVEGLSNLSRTLRRFQGDAEDLKAANAAVAALVAAAASRRARRLTGRMAAAVKGNRATGRAVVSVPRVPYAGPQHWGWPDRGIDADPFVVDAATETESVWLELYARDLQAAADKVRGV